MSEHLHVSGSEIQLLSTARMLLVDLADRLLDARISAIRLVDEYPDGRVPAGLAATTTTEAISFGEATIATMAAMQAISELFDALSTVLPGIDIP